MRGFKPSNVIGHDLGLTFMASAFPNGCLPTGYTHEFLSADPEGVAGINPDRFVFAEIKQQRHIPWAMEEALKCSALTAVVGEIREFDFTASRRLQLAVEQSNVNGFILRNNHPKINPTASTSRWLASRPQ